MLSHLGTAEGSKAVMSLGVPSPVLPEREEVHAGPGQVTIGSIACLHTWDEEG